MTSRPNPDTKPPHIHTKTIAVRSKQIIRSAKAARRGAFALGTFGSFVVMLARRGRPATALAELRKLGAPKETPVDGDKKLPFRELTSGLLYRQGDTLVIQSKKPLNAVHFKKARIYFKVLQVGRPWNKLRIMRLADGDEGDLEGAMIDDEIEQDDADDIIDDGQEDQVEINWSADGAAGDPVHALQNESPPPAYGESEPNDPAAYAVDAATDALTEPPGYTTESARREREYAQRLAKYALDKRKGFELAATADPEKLQALFEQFLKRVPYEHLLLELARSASMEAVANKVAQDAQWPALTSGADGIAAVTDALVAMGTKLAVKRNLLGPADVPNGSKVAPMVKKEWAQHPDVSPALLIEHLIDILGSMIESSDDRWLRGAIGLASRRPTVLAGPNSAIYASIDALIPSLSERWHAAHASAVIHIDVLKKKVEGVLKRLNPTYSVESLKGSWEAVDNIAVGLKPEELAAALNSIPGSVGDTRTRRVGAAMSVIDASIAYLDSSTTIGAIDRAPFEINGSMHDTFWNVLTEIRQTIETQG